MQNVLIKAVNIVYLLNNVSINITNAMLPATRKILMTNPAFNPFHDKFDILEFEKVIGKYDLTNMEELNSIISSFVFFNKFHTDFYLQVVELIRATDKNIKKVIDLIFVGFNRNYFVNHQLSFEEIATTKEVSMIGYSARKVKSVDPTLGEINIIDALETDTDALNLICNLLRHIILEPFPERAYENPVVPIELFKSIHLSASVYYTLKSVYEDGLWNNGEFKFNRENNAIHIVFPNQTRLLLYKIGHFRTQANALERIFFLRRIIEEKSKIGVSIENALQSTKKDKKIKYVNIINGSIVVGLAKKKSLKDLDSELTIIGTIAAYYPFIDLYADNISAQNLSISDFVVLLSCIQEILQNAQDNPIETSLMSLDDMAKYPIKMAVNDLKNYLNQRTTYSEKQINLFLQTIACSFDERIDIWTAPILFYEGFYYFSFLSLGNPIVLNLIDIWLEKTGYPLENRGKLFEDYIKAQLTNTLNKRNFSFKIEHRNNFFSDGLKEEVDLLFALKKMVFVCEVKCMKYSTTSREDHNSYKTLKKASEQAKRKCAFIQKAVDGDDILNEMLKDKTIAPLIIINYPLYTGLDIDGVSVIDFLTLDNYFSSGSVSSGYYKKERGVTQSVRSSTEKYYTDEDSMNINIHSFVKLPTPVSRLLKEYKIVTSKFTPSTFPFEVYSEHSSKL